MECSRIIYVKGILVLPFCLEDKSKEIDNIVNVTESVYAKVCPRWR